MKIFDNIKKQFDNFDFENTIDKSVMLEKNRNKMIALNQEQLYIEGIDSDGDTLKTYSAVSPNVYSQKTISIKKSKNQPTDRVTLFDTGDFYNTFEVKQLEDIYLIHGDLRKENGLISDNVPTSNIFGLTENNMDKFIEINIKKTIFEFVNNFVNNLKI